MNPQKEPLWSLWVIDKVFTKLALLSPSLALSLETITESETLRLHL